MGSAIYDGNWTDYEWLVVVGALLSFAMAWGIGANDVANAFGTSVGAKTLTLKQACLVAAVFEFSGAIGLGGEVTKTIAGSIARPSEFQNDPELFAYGMMCALAAAATWVYVATYLKLAVSTTHSIIGAVVGFALVWKGPSAVVWNDHIDDFPYSKGLVPVICSWFISPITSAIVSSVLFLMTRTFILRRSNSTTLAVWLFPVLVVITVFINIFFVLYKGAKNTLHWEANKAAWVAACVAAGCFVLAAAAGIPYLKWRLRTDAEAQAAEAEGNGEKKDADVEEAEPTSKIGKLLKSASKSITRGMNVDIHKDVEHSQAIHDMHANAEVFDPETEHVFSYLQVFSACAVSFAHGANDVANAIGPFCGIYSVYQNWKISSSAASPYWILALGGAGIVTGLATYGYNIMATLGVGMAKFTPARGYCAELATSFTVVVASVYGLPVSTTQIITGAEVGVGLCENLKTGTNWLLFGKQVGAWVLTLFISGIACAAIFSAGAFAPSITQSNEMAVYEQQLNQLTTGLYKGLNASNFALRGNFSDKPFDAHLNNTIYNNTAFMKQLFSPKVTGYISPDLLMGQVWTAMKTYQNYSTVITGFNPKTRAYSAPGAELAGNVLSVNAYSALQISNK